MPQVVGANQTFLVSDGEDVSTMELLRPMRRAMGRPVRLVPVSAGLLKLAATMVGKQDVAQRLCGSLQVDIEKTRRLLGWSPLLSLDEGLRRAVREREITNIPLGHEPQADVGRDSSRRS